MKKLLILCLLVSLPLGLWAVTYVDGVRSDSAEVLAGDFVNVSGDTMAGNLDLAGNDLTNSTLSAVYLPITDRISFAYTNSGTLDIDGSLVAPAWDYTNLNEGAVYTVATGEYVPSATGYWDGMLSISINEANQRLQVPVEIYDASSNLMWRGSSWDQGFNPNDWTVTSRIYIPVTGSASYYVRIKVEGADGGIEYLQSPSQLNTFLVVDPTATPITW